MSEDDLNKPEDGESRASILNSISNWLKLVALIVLVAEVTIVVAMQSTPKTSKNYDLYPIIMFALLGVVVIGLFVDRFFDRKFTTKSDNQGQEPIGPKVTVYPIDTGKDALLREIVDNVNESRKYNFRVFKEQVDLGLRDFLIRTKNWKNGELKVLPNNYSSVLLNLYGKAEKSIFSTTNKSYIDTWDSSLMKRMMKASGDSKASSVTRVFVFDNRKVINQRAIDVISAFEDNRAFSVRVYLDDEDKAYNFPSDISLDFVMIDEGGAIGITDFVDKEKGEKGATWYIRDENRIEKFNVVVKALIDGSKSSKNIIEWWEKEGKTSVENHD